MAYIYVCNVYAHADCNTRNTGSRRFRALVRGVGLESESLSVTLIIPEKVPKVGRIGYRHSR